MMESRILRLAICMMAVMFMGGVVAHSAYAESHNEQLKQRMKAEFDTAITTGDVDKARQIWSSIDSQFSDRFDRLAARAVIYGGGAWARGDQLPKLYSENAAKFEPMALFLSSINLVFMEERPSSSTGKFSGVLRGKNHKRLAGTKVIVAGHEASTDANGYFSFNALPTGFYDMFFFASAYQLTIDSREIKSGESLPIVVQLVASNTPPPMTAEQAKAKMNAETEKILAEMPESKPRKKGTETLAGTLLDAKTGAPIVKAQVILACEAADAFQALTSPQSTVKQTVSDQNGRFVITEIPTGLCDFSVAQTNASNLADFAEKAQSVGVRGYGYSQRVKMTANASHRHEHTWRIQSKMMKGKQ